jgi:hypothetical protein
LKISSQKIQKSSSILKKVHAFEKEKNVNNRKRKKIKKKPNKLVQKKRKGTRLGSFWKLPKTGTSYSCFNP